MVVVTRESEYELLLRRHATHAQAAFFLENRGQEIGTVHTQHLAFQAVKQQVVTAIPTRWRRSLLGRDDLSRFVFDQSDIVVALGQDGLVANLAKYLRGQTVIGINPSPERNDGVLVRHRPEHAARLLEATFAGRIEVEQRTMVAARLDDGQILLALNEVFIGHRSHQSARYRLRYQGTEERQSSSGIIAASGTGSSGWARSINGERAQPLSLPQPEARRLAFFVREPFPSVATGTSVTGGVLGGGDHLEVISEFNEGGVIFGDGVEDDYLDFAFGMTATVQVAETFLQLAHP